MWSYFAFCCFPPRSIQYIVTEYILYILDTVLGTRDSMAKRVLFSWSSQWNDSHHILFYYVFPIRNA